LNKILYLHVDSYFLRPQRWKTPLLFAAGHGHYEVVRLLLDTKAAIDATQEVGHVV
jgi:ankyrin repeat protein